MSTLQEIEAAIRNLPVADRQKLIADLPALFPELDGDTSWERIIRDPQSRPALSALLDEAQTDYQRDPAALPETSEAEFDRHS